MWAGQRVAGTCATRGTPGECATPPPATAARLRLAASAAPCHTASWRVVPSASLRPAAAGGLLLPAAVGTSQSSCVPDLLGVLAMSNGAHQLVEGASARHITCSHTQIHAHHTAWPAAVTEASCTCCKLLPPIGIIARRQQHNNRQTYQAWGSMQLANARRRAHARSLPVRQL